MGSQQHFSNNYAQARERFLDGATGAGLAVRSYAMPGRTGALGEELATDVARFGRSPASKLLIVSSGIHGVEGFCGSGCQSAMLADDQLLARAERAGVSLLFVHAVNPFGFSWLRRVNEDNVDVNRNFVAFDGKFTPNGIYSELEPLLLPAAWPPDRESAASLQAWIRDNGVERYGQAVFQGQYESPRGMFYGGNAPTWSNRTIREIVRTEGTGAHQIGWIDLHTGLGPRGHCEKVFIGRDAELDGARRWWGSDVIPTRRDDSVMYEIQGPMVSILGDECPSARPTTIALEFGTVPLLRMIDALRADHLCWRDGGIPATNLRASAAAELKDCFYVEAPDWQGMVLGQARTAVVQALCALGNDIAHAQ
jgi:hypothetical protein